MTFEKEDSDQFLFTQLRLGKEEAFDFIFRKYYKGLTVQAMRLVHDQDSAQSLVQDCFVTFWKKRYEISNIVHLKFISFFHGEEPVHRLFKETTIASTGSYYGSDRFSARMKQSSKSEPMTWVPIYGNRFPNCPTRCRIAFEYSRIDELTYHQVALKMGISDKAVEALISRALKLLRADLVDFLYIDDSVHDVVFCILSPLFE